MKKALILLITFIFNSILLISSDNSLQDKSMFPLLGNEARERGYELPNPYGINVIYVDMKQDVDIKALNLTGKLSLFGGKPLELGNIISVKADSAKTVNTNELVKADLWVFPFLNVYGILGKTKGHSTALVDINLGNSTILKNYDFTLKYEGITYGVGTVLAGGYKDFFSLIDFNYTSTSLDIIEGNISAFVISPKVGYNFNFYNTKNSIWIGTMYQNITQTLKGDINNLITFPKGIKVKDGKFEVKESTSSPWNNVIGFRSEINKSVEFTTEVGFGKRKSVTLSLGYRF
ncbi:MAG: hypothetical protein ACRC31_03550 [Cetobacterium sp.]|uniref:hypothetical protein n=1 Tax=Bacteria TaxID=2 RepID=UPI0025C28DF3|nr:hypothetical protein [Cetobacterium sp.]